MQISITGVSGFVGGAAFVDVWGPRDVWYKGNVLGTQAAPGAAREAGVSRFIHMGTEAGIVHGQHITGAT